MGLFATQVVSVILSSNVWGSNWVCDWQAQVCLCLLLFVNISSTGTSSLCHPVTEEDYGGPLLMFSTHNVVYGISAAIPQHSHGHCLEIRGGADRSFLWSGSQVTMEKGKSATLFTTTNPPSSVEWQRELHGPILMGLFEVSRSSVVSRAFCLTDRIELPIELFVLLPFPIKTLVVVAQAIELHSGSAHITMNYTKAKWSLCTCLLVDRNQEPKGACQQHDLRCHCLNWS